ncbi:uncharacterized protein LOC142543646 [Primulina tabacum]|uniref:uncharacterized protein LOC142543646 n=1 Tax=Primulina tabacum TaxID=48773 RepID=UPI003F5AC60E
MAPRKCEVCAEAQSKYKCPICVIPYCSVVCFKKHNEIPCKKLESPVEVKVSEATAISPIVNDEKPLYVEEPSEVLQGVQLESIASSSEIRDAIKDEKLKKLICDIDSALDPEKELHKVMEMEEFRLFTEKILATITP